jgi:hypothetical protein
VILLTGRRRTIEWGFVEHNCVCVCGGGGGLEKPPLSVARLCRVIEKIGGVNSWEVKDFTCLACMK